MNLSQLGRWALGLYPPSIPADLRLTDVRPMDAGLSQITSKVEMRDVDRQRLQEYQQRQHDTRNELGVMTGEREIIEAERQRRTS